jgi:hypothetical protein
LYIFFIVLLTIAFGINVGSIKPSSISSTIPDRSFVSILPELTMDQTIQIGDLPRTLKIIQFSQEHLSQTSISSEVLHLQANLTPQTKP